MKRSDRHQSDWHQRDMTVQVDKNTLTAHVMQSLYGVIFIVALLCGGISNAHAQKTQKQGTVPKQDTEHRPEHSTVLQIAIPQVGLHPNTQESINLLPDIHQRIVHTLSQIGIFSTTTPTPWKRGIAQVQAGDLDGIITSQNLGWYREKFHISDPITEAEVGILTKSALQQASGYKFRQIAAVTVGVLLGDPIQFELSGRAIPYKSLPFSSNLGEILNTRRLDGFVGYKTALEDMIKSLPKSADIAYSPIRKQNIYLMLSHRVKGAESILEQFNAMLKQTQQVQQSAQKNINTHQN